MLAPDAMKLLIDRIIEVGNELRGYHDMDDLAVPNPPASAADLQRLQTKLGRLPTAYLQFLSIYDGVSNFEWVDVDMCSAQYLLEHDDLDESWIDAGAFAKGDLLIIASSNFDAHNVAFLRKTADAAGEMKILNFDSGGPLTEHPDFETYLRERLAWLEESLANEKADRAALRDDE
jgi:SMI1 / KNR4 family (SUKH-1)